MLDKNFHLYMLFHARAAPNAIGRMLQSLFVAIEYKLVLAIS